MHNVLVVGGYALLGVVAFGLTALVANYVGPFIFDVRFGASGLEIVLLRVIVSKRVPYADIISVEPATRWGLAFPGPNDRRVISVLNRVKPIVVVRRRNARTIYAFSPRNHDAFIHELKSRTERAELGPASANGGEFSPPRSRQHVRHSDEPPRPR